MPDSLRELFDQDREARAFYDSLPLFIRDKIVLQASEIQNKEELSGLANEYMRDALKLDQYTAIFEDETDSDADLL